MNWRPNRNDRKHGFTLVELLVVIGLMSVLTGMMSIALSSARQDSRIKRAQAEVRTISVILQQKVNDISLAPVSFVGTFPATTGGVGTVSAIERNRATMLARRDLMRMKLPQCRADLIFPPARIQFVNGTVASATKIEQPSEWAQMRRIAGFAFHSGIQVESASVPAVFTLPAIDSVGQYGGSGPANVLLRARLGSIGGYVIDLSDATSPTTTVAWPEASTPPAGETWTRDFESAECLYLILATTEIFGQRALDQFSARSIANVDGDAVPEIVDPWGNPYEFIRDPVGRGFRVAQTTLLPPETHPEGPDPMDYLRTDFRFVNNDTTSLPTMRDDPYKISPLVVSAGQDGEFGFRRSFDRDGDPVADRMGISPRYSTGATVLTAPPALPGPTLPGAYQYPDSYAQLRASSTSPYTSGADNNAIRFGDLTEATLFSWHGNGTLPAIGLGAAFLDSSNELDEAYADNIASDNPE